MMRQRSLDATMAVRWCRSACRRRERRDPMKAEASLRVLDGFDTAWNAHDEDGVLDLFTADAVAKA